MLVLNNIKARCGTAIPTKATGPQNAVDAAAKATGDAVNKGAYVTGRQIGRAKGMFSAFKDEYDKAVADKPKSTKKNK